MHFMTRLSGISGRWAFPDTVTVIGETQKQNLAVEIISGGWAHFADSLTYKCSVIFTLFRQYASSESAAAAAAPSLSTKEIGIFSVIYVVSRLEEVHEGVFRDVDNSGVVIKKAEMSDPELISKETFYDLMYRVISRFAVVQNCSFRMSIPNPIAYRSLASRYALDLLGKSSTITIGAGVGARVITRQQYLEEQLSLADPDFTPIEPVVVSIQKTCMQAIACFGAEIGTLLPAHEMPPILRARQITASHRTRGLQQMTIASKLSLKKPVLGVEVKMWQTRIFDQEGAYLTWEWFETPNYIRLNGAIGNDKIREYPANLLDKLLYIILSYALLRKKPIVDKRQKDFIFLLSKGFQEISSIHHKDYTLMISKYFMTKGAIPSDSAEKQMLFEALDILSATLSKPRETITPQEAIENWDRRELGPMKTPDEYRSLVDAGIDLTSAELGTALDAALDRTGEGLYFGMEVDKMETFLATASL